MLKKTVYFLIIGLLFFVGINFATITTNKSEKSKTVSTEKKKVKAQTNSTKITKPTKELGQFLDVKTTYGPYGGLNFETENKNFLMRIGGYVQADAFRFLTGSADVVNRSTNLENGMDLRRARLYLGGILAQVWNYNFTYDFASPGIVYAYANYTGFKNQYIMMGQYKPALGLEYIVSDSTFMEAPLPINAFNPEYGIGVNYLIYFDPYTLTAGAFVPGASSSIQGNSVVGDDPRAIYSRFTYAPFHQERRILHFGVTYMYRTTGHNDTVRFRSIPEIVTRTAKYVLDTQNILHSTAYQVGSLETAGVYNSWMVEAEYYLAHVKRQRAKNPMFHGYYLQGSYFLTGESSLYDAQTALFTTITPVLHRYGAWQVAARYSALDLDDEAVIGGKGEDVTLGLNWYPVDYMKFTFNYIYSHLDPSENGKERNINALGLRFQITY